MSLKDLKIQAFTEPVSDLPDNPSQSGITAEELKRRFDANANNELKPSVNGIVDFLLGFTNGEEIKGIRLSSDNIIEVTTDGKNYISTGYSKAYITQMLAEKVDKSDVLLKTNTEEFTPTGIYQPATKKYVDDKVVSTGAADMTQAVYDPTGRQTDIFAEIDKKFDKSGGTIAGDLVIKDGSGKFSSDGVVVQVEAINTGEGEVDRRILRIANRYDEDISTSLNYVEDANGETVSYNIFGEHNLDVVERFFLPLTGGTLAGQQIYFGDGIGRVYFYSGAMQLESINVAGDGSNKRTLFLQNSSSQAISKALRLVDKVSSKDTYYIIYGQHNKPSGSYTGNGSSAERKISVGGAGDVLLVRLGRMCYFVTPEGVTYSTGGAANTSYTITFIDGVLTIPGESNLNNSGQSYYYQVL